MTRPASLLVSGADTGYFSWLQELWQSWRTSGACDVTEFGVMDVGLTAEERTWLEQREVSVVAPDWPFPGLDGNAPNWFKAMVCRPFLPDLFPGFDSLFWIDADSWIQNADAVPLFISGAMRDGFAVVPAVDRGYRPDYHGGNWFLDWQKSCLEKGFGDDIAEKFHRYPIISAGALCGLRQAPHWKVWQDYTELALRQGGIYREAEQTALCVTVHFGNLTTHFLPSWCHWLCNMGFPMMDREQGVFTEPFEPYTPIGIMGLAGNTKSDAFHLPTRDGETVPSTLRYGAIGNPAD